MPPSELLARASGLRITDKVTHATRRPGVDDEQRELSQLTASLASPGPPDLARIPAAQRLQSLLRDSQARRLEVLRRRKQGA